MAVSCLLPIACGRKAAAPAASSASPAPPISTASVSGAASAPVAAPPAPAPAPPALAASSAPPAAVAGTPADLPPAPPNPSPQDTETRLRSVVQTWRKTPYRDNGTTKAGIGNPEFVRAVFADALGSDVPPRYDDQIHSGKLVERPNLAPGDLVFFESGAFGPFKSKAVGIYLGHGDVAIARKDSGIGVVKLNGDDKLNSTYKTARRISASDSTAPTFDVAKYGSDRASLLRDIAKAWSGTLYRANGTTFSGIGNDEFVREVYGAIYETDLEGDPKTWATMGQAVARDKLEPGDIILYEADVVGPFVKQRHAGIYLGNGEFVAAVKGSAVSIVKLDDARWRAVYKGARRIDPDVLARAEVARATPARTSGTRARGGAASARAADSPAVTAEPRTLSDTERRLRDVTEEWRGTPYKLGGNSKSGIDCSAFSRVLYQNVYQVELPRTAEEQEQLGSSVTRDGLQPGDLVFFRTQGMGPLFKSRHVGVYLGGGEFAQASGRHGVTVSRLDQPYWSKKYHSARRVPKTAAVADAGPEGPALRTAWSTASSPALRTPPYGVPDLQVRGTPGFTRAFSANPSGDRPRRSPA